MTRQRISSKGRGTTKSRSTGLETLHRDMKQLVELQRAQEVRFVPEQPDVPRLRFNQDTIYNVELSYLLNVTSSTTAPVFGALSFALSNAIQSSNYTAIFDRYRINQVNVKMIPAAGAQSTGPIIYSVLDYDDANTLSNLASYLGYSTLKVTPPGVIDERTLNPCFATAAYSGTFTSYANMPPSTWLDAASPAVQYYGLKYFIPQNGISTGIQFIITMMVQFKSQRSS